MNKLAALALILTTICTLSPSMAVAKPRVDTRAFTCFTDPGANVSKSDGTMILCCYDDGCWVCEREAGQNCIWDGNRRGV